MPEPIVKESGEGRPGGGPDPDGVVVSVLPSQTECVCGHHANQHNGLVVDPAGKALGALYCVACSCERFTPKPCDPGRCDFGFELPVCKVCGRPYNAPKLPRAAWNPAARYAGAPDPTVAPETDETAPGGPRGPRRSVSLPADLVDRLEGEAHARVVGKNWLAERLIEIGLSRLPEVP